MKKTGLSEDEVELVLGVLLTNLHVIPSKDIMANWKGAEEIMVGIDRSDTPFVAAASAYHVMVSGVTIYT